LTPEVLQKLEAGGKVLLLPAPFTVKGDKFGPVPAGFSSIFWNTAWTNRQPPVTLGVLCDPKHPALTDFPTESHSNWQWWDLIHGSQILILNDLPAELRPVVQVIDDWVTNRRLGLVFEAQVGQGRLVVCGADLDNDLANRPVARQMRASLLNYMNGDSFKPTVSVGAEALKSLFQKPSIRGKVVSVDSESPGYEGGNALDNNPRPVGTRSGRETRSPDFRTRFRFGSINPPRFRDSPWFLERTCATAISLSTLSM
jgi:hypothetical protein